MSKKASTPKPAPKAKATTAKPASTTTKPAPAATTNTEMPDFLKRTNLLASVPDKSIEAFTKPAAPPPAKPEANAQTTPAPAPAPEQAKPAAKAAPKPAIRAKVLDTAIITVVATTNPYKKGSGSHTAFEKYKTGMTLAEAVKAGVKRDWVLYDRRMKYIEIK